VRALALFDGLAQRRRLGPDVAGLVGAFADEHPSRAVHAHAPLEPHECVADEHRATVKNAAGAPFTACAAAATSIENVAAAATDGPH
jgi:hypothetical protein